MIIPDLTLANELSDTCSDCKTLSPAVAVDGKSDEPQAIHKCQCGATWKTEWQRGYTKKQAPTPSIQGQQQTLGTWNPNPSCVECGFPPGGGHAITCPFYQSPI